MLAIIAGNGDLPKLIIESCKKQKKEFVLILVKDNANKNDYKKYKNYVIEIGYVAKALEILRTNKVKEVVFAGGIQKPAFSNIKVDKKGAVLLSKLLANKIFGDDNILSTVTKFFQKEGFKIIGVDKIIPDIISKKGVLTKAKPSKQDLENIKIGQNALKTMSSLDIGQAIAVQQKQIIGIEAIEGTDELIKRCSKLQFVKTHKPVLIKVKKENQNTKIDLPTIGVKTIENLIKANFAGLAVKSGSTLILQKEKIVELANKNKIFIIVI